MQRTPHPNGVVTYTFESLAARPLSAHVSTRHGGVSPAPWATLNFSVARGDDPERVRRNRLRLAEAVAAPAAGFVTCQQVHGVQIALVDEQDAGQRQPGCDGLATNRANLPLMLVFGDCVPVLLYDPVRHALAAVHAGWRGTVSGAAVAALAAMRRAFSTDPADVLAAIGPSIGPQSYYVGAEVVEQAHAGLNGADRFFHYAGQDDANPRFDLWAANRAQLAEAGVPPAQIEVSGIDTATHTHDFYSHRAEQGRCGLFSLVAWLQPRSAE